MRIIYISTVFPNENENSTIYTDLAEELVAKGHKVTVVVAEEKKKCVNTKFVHERGCQVLRVKTGNIYDVGLIEKGISILFVDRLLKSAIKKYILNEKFDLILFEAPPVTISGVVKKAKKLYNAPSFLMMKDIFPQNAVDIGIIKKNSPLHFFFKWKELQLYDIADNIGCMSEGNRQYLITHNHISTDKLSIFPNTKKLLEIPKKDLSIRRKYKISKDKVVFVFGGNMGKPQGMNFLVSAIRAAENIEKAFFVLVGRGTEKEMVKTELKKSKNVVVIDELKRDEYERLISSCDIGIVSLDYRFTIPNYPSRILSYMEYAMPVLAVTDKNTDFKDLLQEAKCGYWCEAKSEADFCKLVRKMCDDTNRDTLGRNGRKYAEKFFTVKNSVELLEGFYKEIKDNQG